MMRKLISLALALALIFLACHSGLPWLARGPGMDVIRSNLCSGVEATAYFYTELDGFVEFEWAVKPAAQPPGGRTDAPPGP